MFVELAGFVEELLGPKAWKETLVEAGLDERDQRFEHRPFARRELEGLEVKRASLEDVYLALTNREQQ